MHPNITAFIAIAETGTVSAAAKKLGLTQTAATQRIKALEKQLGFSLFLRSRTGMKLTEEGKTLLRSGLQARELEGRLASDLRMGAVDNDVSITITAPGGIITRRIIPQCEKLYQKLISYSPADPLGADYLREFHLLEELKRPRLYANENEAVLAWVLLGVGFALLPRELVLPYIKQKKLIALNDGRAFKIPFALVWYPRSEMPAYFRDLIQAIK
jgi:DNA-binding transcriptional LysR family regulator